MKPGTERIAKHLLATNSVRKTMQAMRDAGVSITESELTALRRVMIEAGERAPTLCPPGGNTYDRSLSEAGFRDAAIHGSAALLKRQIATGQVFPGAMARWHNRHGAAA